uniref:Cation/H+ exchanger transmembrane domain-containing protein n=1 Tax=Proboscia inermis TaxID=420281 RepID=A0A7S0BZ08_9STRA|mmetsp:Transcript_17601/g.17815  ORF Transcript_17601/g.17815 Transcript_17601/m.17815 type:complete len:403 (+) Transcript_17601:3-1211(+)
MIMEALSNLRSFVSGAKSDALLLLFTTAFITPLCRLLHTSPILGYIASGILLGPQGLGTITDVHTTEHLADLGIVFFLFEMGIHLNFDTLMEMRTDVFGLGMSQFTVTALAIAAIVKLTGVGGGTVAAMVVLGGGLALSSSAFVLQLLREKGEMKSRFGRASFGVLLLQDLMVVPLLVLTPVLAKGGDLGAALGSALVRIGMALSAIAVLGKWVLRPVFDRVEASDSQEAFVGVMLGTVLSMSFLTEGLGLSNTLGAFLAGVLLSETKHRHRIEKELSPIRGILVGLFFFSVGFEVDLPLIMNKFGLVAGVVLGILCIKTVIAAAMGLAFGLDLGTSQHLGLVLSQGGEFAFVAFHMARDLEILNDETTRLMLTCVSLTMAFTPFLDGLGHKLNIQAHAKES